MFDLTIRFSAKLWVYQGKSGWHFITLPVEEAEQIRFFQNRKAGFGSVRTKAQIGQTQWETSLFPDKKSGSYFLPVKADIRKKENLRLGDTLEITLLFESNFDFLQ